MYEVRVLNGQTLFDIAIQETGSMENAYAIAEANGIALSDDPPEMLTIPDGIITDNGVTECFTARKIKPATGMSIVPGHTWHRLEHGRRRTDIQIIECGIYRFVQDDASDILRD